MVHRCLKLFGPFLLLLVTFASLELGGRALYTRITPERGRAIVSLLLGETRVAQPTGIDEEGFAVSEVEPRPYYFYVNRPGGKAYGIVQHNGLGHRGPEYSTAPRPGTLRILAIGGSTTYGWLLKDYRDAWPHQLELLLSARLQHPVEVINAGLPSGLSTEALISYALRDRFLGAQAVIIHMGGNDAGAAFYDDYRSDYSTYRSMDAGDASARPGERRLLRSFLARTFYAWWLRDGRASSIRTFPDRPLDPATALTNARNRDPVGYRRNLDLLVRTVIDEGALPILFPFYLAEKEVFRGLSPSHRFGESTYEALKADLEKNVTITREIAALRSVPFVSLAPGTIPLPDFFDHCHLRPEGERIKAEFLSDQVVGLVRAGRIHAPWKTASSAINESGSARLRARVSPGTGERSLSPLGSPSPGR